MDKSVVFLTTLHEDPTEHGFYLYYSQYDRTPIYAKLIEIGQKYLPLKKEDTVYGDKLVNGLVQNIDLTQGKHKCCTETFFWRRGIPYMTVETPGQADLQQRVKFQRKAMDFTLLHLAEKSS